MAVSFIGGGNWSTLRKPPNLFCIDSETLKKLSALLSDFKLCTLLYFLQTKFHIP